MLPPRGHTNFQTGLIWAQGELDFCVSSARPARYPVANRRPMEAPCGIGSRTMCSICGLRELRRGTELIAVEPQVFDLLTFLIHHRDHVVSKDDLMAAIWNRRIVSESALTSRINSARAALRDTGEEQRLIKTLRGKGFRFVGAVSEAEHTSRAMPAVQPRPQVGRRSSAISRRSPCCHSST